MRIALVVEIFEPAAGGVEQVVWRVARGLCEAGDRVCVVARRGREAPGVELRRVEVPAFWQPLRVRRFDRESARCLAAHEFDVVHSFTRTSRQDVFHAGGGCHADYMERTYGQRGAARRRISPRHARQLSQDRRIFEDATQLIQCPSRMVAAGIAHRYAVPPERLAVVHNGVDAARFDPDRHAEAGRALRAEFGAGDAPIWLFLGSGWRRKGLDTALRALAACEERRALLWVVGGDEPGPWRRLADRLGVRDRVAFLGTRADPERLHAASDGLLLPSRYDAFGLVCLEAAAAGRPVVASGSTGAAELLTDAGVVVDDAEDAAGFAAALSRLGDAALRRRLGERGREVARERDWVHQVAALRELYRRVPGR